MYNGGVVGGLQQDHQSIYDQYLSVYQYSHIINIWSYDIWYDSGSSWSLWTAMNEDKGFIQDETQGHDHHNNDHNDNGIMRRKDIEMYSDICPTNR